MGDTINITINQGKGKMSSIASGAGGGGGGSGGRAVLTANTEYYVATTGNDISGTGTLAKPWKTLQKAMNFVAGMIDTGGFLARVNIGAGTFAGVGLKSYVGGGAMEFKGAGPASTTIDNGPNDGVYNTSEPFSVYPPTWCSFYLNELQTKPSVGSGNAASVYVNSGQAEIIIGQDQDNQTPGHFTMDSGAASAKSFVTLNGPNCSFLDSTTAQPAITLKGNALNYISADINSFVLLAGIYTISGTPAYSDAFIRVTRESSLITFGPTFTGAATGVRFNVGPGCGIVFGSGSDPAGTLFPGNTVGALADGTVYSGITDFVGGAASLPAAIQNATAYVTNANSTTFGTIVAAGGANFVPVYADGTNWRIG